MRISNCEHENLALSRNATPFGRPALLTAATDVLSQSVASMYLHRQTDERSKYASGSRWDDRNSNQRILLCLFASLRSPAAHPARGEDVRFVCNPAVNS